MTNVRGRAQQRVARAKAHKPNTKAAITKPANGKTSGAKTTAKPSTNQAAKTKGWSATPSTSQRSEIALQTAQAAQLSLNDVATPAAVTRALFAIANQVNLGGDPQQIAMEAAKEFMNSPEAMDAFRKAAPWLQANAVDLGKKSGALGKFGRVAAGALPLVFNGKVVTALLKVAGDVAGPLGRRLVGAAMRGFASGKGVEGAAVELLMTATKAGLKSGVLSKVLSKNLLKAVPVIGSLISLVPSLIDFVRAMNDPNTTKGQLTAKGLSLALTIAGCVIPGAGYAAIAVDVGAAFL